MPGSGNNSPTGNNSPYVDASGNITYDISGTTYVSPKIVSDLSSSTVTGTGYEITDA